MSLYSDDLPAAQPRPARTGVPTISPAPATAEPAHLLVVDDDRLTRFLMKHLCHQAGFAVDFAATGEEALVALRRKTYDLVLMDVLLPGLSGIETTRRIIEEHGPARPPIIAVTGQALYGDRERLLRAGMDAYLAKPFTREPLMRSIYTLLGRGRSAAD